MIKWYYQHKSKMYGPIEQNFLVDLLMLGEIEKSTLCCPEDAMEWRSFIDFIDLRNALKTAYVQINAKPQDCILLVKKKDQWLQEGPFSFEQVCEKLNSGQISRMDRIWMDGFASWVPLFKIADFRQDVLNLDTSSKFDLLNVVEATEGL